MSRMRYHRNAYSYRVKGSLDYIAIFVVAVALLYGAVAFFCISTLSRHENDSLQFSPSVLRSRSKELVKHIPNGKPRVFGYYFAYVQTSSLAQRPPSRLPVHWENALYELYPSKRMVPWDDRDREAQESLRNSEPYNEPNHNPMRPYAKQKECVPMHVWQTRAYPNCNLLHERELRKFFHKQKGKYHELVHLIAHGYFRDVYMIKDVDTTSNIALKTNRFARRFDQWTMDRHRMDALVMDRMTSSSNIMDIYGYCGVGSLVEFADGGDLMTLINKESSASFEGENSESKYFKRLTYAFTLASALADLHTIDSRDNKFSSIVHGKSLILSVSYT